jgi:hypothetical protein
MRVKYFLLVCLSGAADASDYFAWDLKSGFFYSILFWFMRWDTATVLLIGPLFWFAYWKQNRARKKGQTRFHLDLLQIVLLIPWFFYCLWVLFVLLSLVLK